MITAKRSVLVLFTMLLLLLTVQAVAAQSPTIFDSFKNIFGADFGQLYTNNWWIVDLLVYLFFFGYVGKLALGQQFQGKGGVLGTVFGVALAIALTVFEAKSGFKLGDLGPFALAILVLALAFITWKFFDGIGMGKGGAAAFAVVVVYGTLATVASPLLNAMKASDNSAIKAFASILDLLLLIAVIAVAWKGIGFVIGLFSGKGWRDASGGLKEAFTDKKDTAKEQADEATEKAEETAEEKDEKRILALVNRVEAIERRGYQDAGRMSKDIDEIIRLVESGRRDQQVLDAIGYKIKDIELSGADMKNINVALTTTLAELDAAEKAEVKLAQDALVRARGIAQTEIKKEMRIRKFTAAHTKRLTVVQKAIDSQISNIAMQQWISTRKELDTHAATITKLESELPPLFNQAISYLKMPGRIASAISTLRSVKALLVKIESSISYLERVDITKLKQRIKTSLKDLQVDKNVVNRLKNDFYGNP